MEAVKERVAGLLKGCGCRTGCQTRQCGCRAKERACGEGCTCMSCTNTENNGLEEESMPEEINDKISIPNDMDELMEWVFGEQVATEMKRTTTRTQSNNNTPIHDCLLTVLHCK